jgi:hypothetical protein
MITVDINKFNGALSLTGLSTDDKPVDTIMYQGANYKVVNSSTYYEMDTKKVSIFDEENQMWHDV